MEHQKLELSELKPEGDSTAGAEDEAYQPNKLNHQDVKKRVAEILKKYSKNPQQYGIKPDETENGPKDNETPESQAEKDLDQFLKDEETCNDKEPELNQVPSGPIINVEEEMPSEKSSFLQPA